MRGAPQARVVQFEKLARDGAAHPAIQCEAARALALAKGDLALAALLLLRLVQRLPYLPDPAGPSDWTRAPCRVLLEGGDCDDLVVLAVALFLALGIPARVAWIEQGHATQDHVAAEVWLGGRWRWCETTLRGARLGEHPHAAAARLAGGRSL